MTAKKRSDAEKRAKAQAHAAGRLLTGDWLERLASAIKFSRDNARGLDNFAKITPEVLALIVAHVVTHPQRDEDDEEKLPSPLTVALEIGRLLGAADWDTQKSAGGALLGMAEACGFIVFTDGEKRKALYQAPKEVRLSRLAELEREAIEARLAASNVPPDRPLLKCPPVDVIITRNYKKGLKDPPMPEGWAVAKSLEPIQGTAWRINPYMLETLRRLKKSTADKAAYAQGAQFRDAPEFFYRCTFDWRGRLYQRGGRLQYTSGTDAARALLEFAHGERLTSDGRGYLAIHVATCFGITGPLTDRAVWADKFDRRIASAVADPVRDTWWRKAKEPYRFLAACRAWRDVAANPRAPVHLPVTADATASAFQHYAWLLRDEDLGRRVNLEPCQIGARAHDFYGDIAKHSPYSRKEVKAQAWMMYSKAPGKWRDGKQRAAADVVKRERAVQALIKAAAPRAWELYLALRRAAKAETEAGRELAWTLPDGFRVLQDNRHVDTKKVEVWLHAFGGAWHLQARRRVVTGLLDINAQGRGLPPNLIHSLDACLLRAIVREGYSRHKVARWAVAHDSIGVHPNDGGRLRKAIVEAVECVYGPDVLGSLGLTCDGVEHAVQLPASMCGSWYTFS